MQIQGVDKSFNSVRGYIIDNAIKKARNNWLINNQDMIIPYNGEKITIKQWVSKRITKTIIDKFEHSYKTIKTMRVNDANKKGIPYSEEDTNKFLGYTLKDLSSPKFFEFINRKVEHIVEEYLFNSCPNNFNINDIKVNSQLIVSIIIIIPIIVQIDVII